MEFPNLVLLIQYTFLYQIEQKTDMRAEFERCISNYKKEIKQLNDLIKTKDKCIRQSYDNLYN